MIRVVAYIRGSTEEQQNTLDAQRSQIEAYCAYKNLELVRVYVDEGESAFSCGFYERPAAARMMAELSELGAEAIIITKLDRGFRNTADCIFTIDDLQRRKIGTHILDIQLDPNSPVGRLMVTMLAAFAEFENKRRSERQRAAFETMKSAHQRCGTIPYGWTAVTALRQSKTGRQGENLVPDPDEQRWLRTILEDWSDLSVNEIARRLNRAGVPAKKGGKWFGSAIAGLRTHGQLDETTEAQAAA